jgi:DNA-binding NarL/FixJ family response regulator
MSGAQCVLLADRHHGLTEGLYGLLKEAFDAVVMVADETSLHEIASRTRPTVAVVDLSLAQGDSLDGLKRLRSRCPDMKIIVISVHDEPLVRERAMESGVDGFVSKRVLATDLLSTIDAALETAEHKAKETR